MIEQAGMPRLAEHGAELAALRQHLQERDRRQEALNALVSRLGHDFKNLLVPQLGYVSMIQEELNAESPAFRFATKLQIATQRNEQLLEMIMTAVRPKRRFAARRTDLKALIEDQLRQWHSGLPSSSPIQASWDLAPCELDLDGTHWRNAFSQLLANAQWALSKGGELRVHGAARTLNAAQQDTLSVERADIYEVVFADTGCGMKPEVLARAFEPFFSTRSSVPGAGLGLTVVHGVVRLHGGQLLLESAPDLGTTLTLWLPRDAHQ